MINAIIDISHHNILSSIDALKRSGILGIIHKATQGTTHQDPTYANRIKHIQDAGLLPGAYHFGTAGDAAAQADFFLSCVGEDQVMVLDFEPNPHGHDMSLLEAEAFVHHIHAATGRYPGLYSGHAIKEALLAGNITSPSQTELSNCWLWIAQYANAPLLPRIWDKWTLWQYTDGAMGNEPHTADGIGLCDRDYFNGSADELRAFWAENLRG